MTSATGAEISMDTVRSGKAVKQWCDIIISVFIATGHQRVSVREPKQSAGNTDTQKLYFFGGKFRSTLFGIRIMSITAVNDDVTFLKQFFELIQDSRCRFTGRQH